MKYLPVLILSLLALNKLLCLGTLLHLKESEAEYMAYSSVHSTLNNFSIPKYLWVRLTCTHSALYIGNNNFQNKSEQN